jgi:signal transduction histidine kinase
MEIRKRLSYQFIGIVALILLISSWTIYVSFSGTRRDDFFDRLGSKATMVAQMLIEFDEIDADLLKRIESNNPLSLPNEKIIIFDYQNRVVYTTDEAHVLEISTESIDKVRLNGEIRFKQGPYEILGQFYTGQYERFVVFAAATDIFGLSKLKRLRLILLMVFFFSLVIAFFSGRIFATRALRPISNITSQAEAIGVSNLDARVTEGDGKDEITRLAQTFNRMLERLEVAFKTQKSFIANASHELRTPLTVITGQLEVILMKARTNDQYRGTILSLLEDIKNLNQISNRLLILAQASSDFAETGFAQVRIDDTIWQARNEVLKRHGNFRVNVHFSEEIDNEDKLTVNGNELLLRTALVNLIDNGCKYSEDHTVEVHFSWLDRDVIIQFSDRGIGIPPGEINLIFQPFYRARNAIGIKGHGIGLSLVEKIITLHGGEITIVSEENKGTDISIRLHTAGYPA